MESLGFLWLDGTAVNSSEPVLPKQKSVLVGLVSYEDAQKR